MRNLRHSEQKHWWARDMHSRWLSYVSSHQDIQPEFMISGHWLNIRHSHSPLIIEISPWPVQPVFGLLSVKHLSTITIKYSPEQMLIINCTLAPGRDWDNFSLCLSPGLGPSPSSMVSQYRSQLAFVSWADSRLLWTLHCSLVWMSAREN